jgi:general secretion pathway protein J
MWQSSWRNAERLPAAVRVTVRNAVDRSALPITRIAIIRVTAPADSVCNPLGNTCDTHALLTDATARASTPSEQ